MVLPSFAGDAVLDVGRWELSWRIHRCCFKQHHVARGIDQAELQRRDVRCRRGRWAKQYNDAIVCRVFCRVEEGGIDCWGHY